MNKPWNKIGWLSANAKKANEPFANIFDEDKMSKTIDAIREKETRTPLESLIIWVDDFVDDPDGFALTEQAADLLAAYDKFVAAGRLITIGCRGLTYWDDLNTALSELDKVVGK